MTLPMLKTLMPAACTLGNTAAWQLVLPERWTSLECPLNGQPRWPLRPSGPPPSSATPLPGACPRRAATAFPSPPAPAPHAARGRGPGPKARLPPGVGQAEARALHTPVLAAAQKMAAKTQGGIRLSAVSGPDRRGARAGGGLRRGRALAPSAAPAAGARRGVGALWQPRGAGAACARPAAADGRAAGLGVGCSGEEGAAWAAAAAAWTAPRFPSARAGSGVRPGWERRLAPRGGVKSCRPSVGKGELRSPSSETNRHPLLASDFSLVLNPAPGGVLTQPPAGCGLVTSLNESGRGYRHLPAVLGEPLRRRGRRAGAPGGRRHSPAPGRGGRQAGGDGGGGSPSWASAQNQLG